MRCAQPRLLPYRDAVAAFDDAVDWLREMAAETDDRREAAEYLSNVQLLRRALDVTSDHEAALVAVMATLLDLDDEPGAGESTPKTVGRLGELVPGALERAEESVAARRRKEMTAS